MSVSWRENGTTKSREHSVNRRPYSSECGVTWTGPPCPSLRLDVVGSAADRPPSLPLQPAPVVSENGVGAPPAAALEEAVPAATLEDLPQHAAGATQQDSDNFVEMLESVASLVDSQVQLALQMVRLYPDPGADMRAMADKALSRLDAATDAFSSEVRTKGLANSKAVRVLVNGRPHSNGLEEHGDVPRSVPHSPSTAGKEKILHWSPGASSSSAGNSAIDSADSCDDLLKLPPTNISDKKPGSPALSCVSVSPRSARSGKSVRSRISRMAGGSTGTNFEERTLKRRMSFHLMDAPKVTTFSGILGTQLSEGETLSMNEGRQRQEQQMPRLMIHPDWLGRYMWDFIVVMLVTLDSLFLPYQLAYKSPVHRDAADLAWFWTLTLFFTADIVVNFFTAHVINEGVEVGKLVTDRVVIAKHYLRGSFPIDFISTIPWFYLGQFIHEEDPGMAEITKVVKFVRLFRVFRLLRLAKLSVIWDRFEESMGSLHVLQLVALMRALLVIFCICHWNACLWYIVGKPNNFVTDMFMSREAQERYEALPHWTTQPRMNGSHDGTWRWIDRHPSDIYIFCFYWTLGVMRTMPQEVTPVNQVEWAYVMAFMFLAFSVFAIGVTTITQTFFKLYERRRVFNEDMAAVRSYLKSIDAPLPLQESIKSFMHLLFDRRRIQANEATLFQSLPKPLAQKLKLSKVVFHIRRLEILKGLPYMTLLIVSTIAEAKDLVPGDVLCQRGEEAEAAWVLVSGNLQELPCPRSSQAIEVVDEDCLLLGEDHQSTRTVCVGTCSEVIRLQKRPFFQLAQHHPPLEERLRRMQAMDEFSGVVAVEADTPLLGAGF